MESGNQKINILFVLPNFDTGGSEKLVVDLVMNLDKTKFCPVVCVFFSGVYEKKMNESGIPFYAVHEGGKIKSKVAIVKFLNRIVRKHSIDVVNTHHSSTLLQGLLSFKLFNRIKLIHTEHTRLDYDPHITPSVLKIQKVFMKFVDVALGISQGVCDYMKEEFCVPERKIVKILNGIDIDKFKRAENGERRTEKRKELGIGQEDVVIGTFANFRKQKNHACLIRAFALIKEKIENREESIEKPVKVLFAGSGPELENIQKLCKELGIEFFDCFGQEASSIIYPPFSILFAGSRSDIPELMNAIDIYCLPSHFEGLPFSLIEAFAAGKKVVATDVDGNREVIEEMGEGVLVESDNTEELAEVLLKNIEDRAEKVERQKKPFPFSFQIMVKKYEELFLRYGNK